jgi:hypothetical protein
MSLWGGWARPVSARNASELDLRRSHHDAVVRKISASGSGVRKRCQ